MEEDKEKVDDYMLEAIFDGLLNAIKTKDKNNKPTEVIPGGDWVVSDL